MEEHRYQDLIRIFDTLFRESHNTVLVRGESEPVYLPKGPDHPCHRIVFAHGYFASALHEMAHWTVAGKKRRLLEDFGYWYNPDGRTVEQQRLFERVEVKPQAWEWLYAVACGFSFRFSADNLNGQVGEMGPFMAAVHRRVLWLLERDLPNPRGARLVGALRRFYQQPALHAEQFDLAGASV